MPPATASPAPPPPREETFDDIQESLYLRQRLDPRPGDRFYLHLSDLRLALEEHRTDAPLRVLDYGAGGSPYRSLFPNADYRRADFAAVGKLDYTLGEDSRIDERDGTFDLILSTQVAEHLLQPETYFAECHRLLKPGGRLICSTHGTFEEHGCPYDYQRWTAAGLENLLRGRGFEVDRVAKLTTGPRAVLFLLDQNLGSIRLPATTLWGAATRLVYGLHTRARALIHRQADRHYAAYRNVHAAGGEHPFYICLLASARKAA